MCRGSPVSRAEAVIPRPPVSPPRWVGTRWSTSCGPKSPSSLTDAERQGGPSGVILCDKPAGLTSHDLVARLRVQLGRRGKVGHAGTLDPFATGLLLILVGRATRVQRFLMALPKRYEAVARFGAVSSTQDPEGQITETGVVPPGDLDLPTGTVRQRPRADHPARSGSVVSARGAAGRGQRPPSGARCSGGVRRSPPRGGQTDRRPGADRLGRGGARRAQSHAEGRPARGLGALTSIGRARD